MQTIVATGENHREQLNTMEITYSTIWFYFGASKKLMKRNESFLFFICLGFCLLNNMSFLCVIVVSMFSWVFYLFIYFFSSLLSWFMIVSQWQLLAPQG